MHSRIIAGLTWSIAIAGAAWLAGWASSQAMGSLGVPAEAVAVLNTVAVAAVCFGGCRFAALRLDQPGSEVAPLLAGPAALALTSFLIDQPWWYRFVAAAGIVLASGLGLVAARSGRSHPLDQARGSPPRR